MKKRVNFERHFSGVRECAKDIRRLSDSDRMAQQPISEKETKKRKRAAMRGHWIKFELQFSASMVGIQIDSRGVCWSLLNRWRWLR